MGTSPAERITNCSVYTFSDELIVELTGEDEDGIIVALSYQFEYEHDRTTVQPKQPVDPEHASYVQDGLDDHGYDWVEKSGS